MQYERLGPGSLSFSGFLSSGRWPCPSIHNRLISEVDSGEKVKSTTTTIGDRVQQQQYHGTTNHCMARKAHLQCPFTSVCKPARQSLFASCFHWAPSTLAISSPPSSLTFTLSFLHFSGQPKNNNNISLKYQQQWHEGLHRALDKAMLTTHLRLHSKVPVQSTTTISI